MKYNLHVNQKRALELGINSINQAHVFDLLSCSQLWAKPEILNGEVFYWVARQRICEELEILSLKPDTVYRHLKSLNELKLIEYKKLGKKDLIQITTLGKSYYVGNRSELDKNPEIDPSKFGNRSENNSEIDPTYNTTNTNHTTIDNNNAESKIPSVFFTKKEVREENERVAKAQRDYCKEITENKKEFESMWKYFFNEYKKEGKPLGSKSEANKNFLKKLKTREIEEIKQSFYNYFHDCKMRGYGFMHLVSFLSASKKYVEEWKNGSENHQAFLELKSKPLNTKNNSREINNKQERIEREVSDYGNMVSSVLDDVFKSMKTDENKQKLIN
jgi:DNA-binding transcriptional ArsR family regulator